jgi:acyl carrier protein
VPATAAALPPPEQVMGPAAAEQKPLTALTMTEEQLMKIWAQLLGCRINTIDENFFDLGGHSLLATQLTLKINHAFNVQLPMNVVYSSPTIVALARAIDALKQNRGIDSGTHRMLQYPLF